MSEQFLDQVLEAVAVGVGADQPRGGPGAIERRGHDPEIGLHDADVEAREMIELQPLRIGEQRLEIGRGIVAAAPEADEMLVALAVRQLHQAQPVAARHQAHRLGVDGDRPVGELHVGGQVFFVQMDRHSHSSDQALHMRFSPPRCPPCQPCPGFESLEPP